MNAEIAALYIENLMVGRIIGDLEDLLEKITNKQHKKECREELARYNEMRRQNAARTMELLNKRDM